MRVIHVVSYLAVGVILFLGLCPVNVEAQVAPPRTTTFVLPAVPDADALEKRDLRWIKTGNDFDQSRFATAEEIDREIEKRLRAYDRETAIVTYEVPINSMRLVKPINKKTYMDFDARISVLSDQPLNSEAYFWRYGDIDIAVLEDTYQDQLNVYGVIRALEILRCRYPKAYQKLFVETRTFAPQAPKPGTWINRFKTLLVSFHSSTKADIAEGGQAIGANEDTSGPYGKYSNLGVISIHATKILGKEVNGSSVLYKKNPDENYLRYLREGLVETLVHEMLHRYVDTRTNIDDLPTLIFNARPPVGGTARPLNILWEEVFVINTSLSFFTREGGLQPPIPYYYRGVLEGSIAALHGLRLARVSDDMSRLNNFNGNNYIEIMRLNVLD